MTSKLNDEGIEKAIEHYGAARADRASLANEDPDRFAYDRLVTKARAALVSLIAQRLAERDARIDALMMEYCPDDMTDEQIVRYAENQQPVPEEVQAMTETKAPHWPPPMPSRNEAVIVWRKAYVDRMVERGVDRYSAQACCDAGDADLSEDPRDAADDELSYWANDEGVV